jgi:hypothetical protein
MAELLEGYGLWHSLAESASVSLHLGMLGVVCKCQCYRKLSNVPRYGFRLLANNLRRADLLLLV